MKITNKEDFNWGLILGVCSIVMILMAFYALGGMVVYSRIGIVVSGGMIGALAVSSCINGIVDEREKNLT
jgi:hypothetical protein